MTTAAARLLAVAALATASSACSPSLRTTPLAFGDARGVFTNGNLRLVTERSRLQPASGRILPTVCTEPNPDYAIAFDQSAALAANVVKLGDGAFDVDSREAATSLAGRSPGVLALRDGLYAACQSYANGVIGHDAYALILSQYSDLLVELIHAGEPEFQEKTATPTPPPADGKPVVVAAAIPTIRNAVLSDPALTHQTGGAVLLAAAAPSPSPAAPASRDMEAIESERAKDALHAALLVACISEHDPTRIGGEDGREKNPMLTQRYCRGVLRRSLAPSSRSITRLSAR